MLSFRIRKMQPADVEAICALHTQSILQICAPHYTPEAIAAWIKGRTPEGYLKNQAKGESFHVAETDDGQVIGFSGWKGNELYGLYVHPQFQGCGAGAALLHAAEAEAVTKGTPITKLVATLNAMPFYKRHGYRVSTKSYATEHGVRVPRYYMRKA